MYPQGNLFIPTAHGRLEAILKEPEKQSSPPKAAALVLHPDPQHGATMHNKVVFRAARALNECGIVTLRFNYRGVGLSTGTFGEGKGEMEDARICLDYLADKYSDLLITLAGFSFGARFGLEVGLNDARVVRLIGIGVPVDKYDFNFLKSCRKPILFVQGENDEFGRTEKLIELASTLPPEANAQVKIIRSTGHFFDGKIEELMEAIKEWVQKPE